ncbi:MCP four helix bundle domain-containing protein [Arcobacter lanthieri]|uniref:HAMP domain-containing methyl-accepting chemotaxis protein n=1 Tax=Aliarcobacter lanthieri TaxID=1355374 RepID=UPI001923E740|nr:methyl-accepting chemotaxis protein [Aliarcobacter lanthieri]MBL3521012.1 MCP four helix bundle domain-containing protein [Aliarcobacter lanthieri]
MSVKRRLQILSLVFILGLIVIGLVSFNSAKSISNDLDSIANERIPALLSLSDLNTERMSIRSQTLDVLTLDYNSNNKDRLIEIANQRKNSWETIDKNWAVFQSIPRNTEAGKKAAASLQKAYEDWRTIYITLDGIIAKLTSNTNLDTQLELYKEYETVVEKMIPISNDFGKLMSEQKNRIFNFSLKMVSDSTKKANSSVIQIAIIFIIVTIVGMIFTILTINMINSSLKKVRDGVLGFFSFVNEDTKSATLINLNTNDEFGEIAKVINTNIEKTQISILKDDEFIQNVEDFIKELSNGNMVAKIEKEPDTTNLKTLKVLLVNLQNYLEHTIARDINVLLRVIDSFKQHNFTDRFPNPYAKVSVAMNELGNIISELLKQSYSTGLMLQNSSNELLDNVNTLNQSSNTAAASLEETAAALEEITSTVVSNSNNVSQMARYSKEVSDSAKKGQNLANQTTTAMDEINNQVNLINEAISVIDNIAFQTNILSLNAAVEAATAGEAGKGFAVVAQEVRNLAARSAEAAKQIKDIVESATSKANEGKDISFEMIKGYTELLENIEKQTQTINEIATASKEQEAGITQINDAVTGLDQQTQKNASIAADTKDIAIKADEIARKIVDESSSQEFIGKEEVENIYKNSSVQKKINTKQVIKEVVSKPKKEIKPSSKEDDEWENF